ncbi:MAG TPA: aldehyde dehydrogenase family protein [Acidimicrobiales bacterium]|jgi:acyl-CoA reductase-like NAD-dependent aldehyde dehydrogenase|nr:aldehyde dehydrogenase family protein [Acidimicrobiales bacterium]
MSTDFRVINPATEQEIASVAAHDLDETNRAIDRASSVAPAWAKVTPADRARLLRRFADVVDSHVEELAQLEVANAGHTISNARWEAGNVRDVLLYYSGAPERHSGRQIPVAGGVDITFYEPLGVVGIIVPWNFPMPIAGWGLAPALAAGNTVVLKPATLTPLTALRLGELALEAGIPEGVFQVVTGDGAMVGNRFVTHPAIRKVCFTGSNVVGRRIMEGCAAQVKRVTLELGGKSANVIFADADLEKAAASAPYAVFDNAGQDCCARSRLLVEASAYDRFMELFELAVKAVKVLDPSNESSEMGPLITASQRDAVRAYVTESEVAFRGSAPEGPGYWMAPTVLETNDTSSRAFQEEIFGPVVSVVRFSDEAEAIAIANESPYGLSGSIWSRDIGRALRVARGVETGALSVNSNSSVRYSTPFGGFKQSGLGRELGPDALLGFSEEKNVFISTEDN